MNSLRCRKKLDDQNQTDEPRVMSSDLHNGIVDLARAILSGEVEVFDGVRQIARLIYALPVVEHGDPDLIGFLGVDSELDNIPIGNARRYWAPEALAEKDRQRDAYLAAVRESIENG